MEQRHGSTWASDSAEALTVTRSLAIFYSWDFEKGRRLEMKSCGQKPVKLVTHPFVQCFDAGEDPAPWSEVKMKH